MLPTKVDLFRLDHTTPASSIAQLFSLKLLPACTLAARLAEHHLDESSLAELSLRERMDNVYSDMASMLSEVECVFERHERLSRRVITLTGAVSPFIWLAGTRWR